MRRRLDRPSYPPPFQFAVSLLLSGVPTIYCAVQCVLTITPVLKSVKPGNFYTPIGGCFPARCMYSTKPVRKFLECYLLHCDFIKTYFVEVVKPSMFYVF